jgi:hypothetical protein
MSLIKMGSWDLCQRPIFPRKHGNQPWTRDPFLQAGRRPFLAKKACFCRKNSLPTPEKVADTWQARKLA